MPQRLVVILAKQFALAASAHELQFVRRYAVDQQPIRLNVAFAVPFPAANERTVAIAILSRLLVYERFDHRFQLAQVHASAKQALHIAPRPGRLADDKRHRLVFPFRKQLGRCSKKLSSSALQFRHCFQGLLIGAFDGWLERQTAHIDKLLQEHADGVRGGQTKRTKNNLCLLLELWANS